MMVTISDLEASLQEEIQRRNFVLAVALAQKIGYPSNEIRYLQERAIKQEACEYRNSFAVSNLARDWGFSKGELEGIVNDAIEEYERDGNSKLMAEQYDAKSGRYLTIRQWIQRYLSEKDKH